MHNAQPVTLEGGEYVMFFYEGPGTGVQEFILTVYGTCMPMLNLTRRKGQDIERFYPRKMRGRKDTALHRYRYRFRSAVNAAIHPVQGVQISETSPHRFHHPSRRQPCAILIIDTGNRAVTQQAALSIGRKPQNGADQTAQSHTVADDHRAAACRAASVVARAACIRSASSYIDSPPGIRPLLCHLLVGDASLLLLRSGFQSAAFRARPYRSSRRRESRVISQPHNSAMISAVRRVRPRSLAMIWVMPSAFARSATCHACCSPFSVNGLSEWP